MNVSNNYICKISEKETLLFTGYITEKDNLISLLNKSKLGEIKLYKLNKETECKL